MRSAIKITAFLVVAVMLMTSCRAAILGLVSKQTESDTAQKETETETASESSEAPDETVSIPDLTNGLWECTLRQRAVYKFFGDGRLYEYPVTEAAVIREDQTHEELTYRENGENGIVIEYMTGSRKGLTRTLKAVDKNSDADWDEGLKSQLAKIPDGEIFLYETGWKKTDGGGRNAFYMARSECVRLEDIDEGWKKGLIGRLIDLREEDDYDSDYILHHRSFSLMDVDRDGIPELFFDTEIHATGSMVYTYHNGEVNEEHLSTRFLGKVAVNTEQSLLYTVDGNMGEFFYYVIKLESGEFTQLHKGHLRPVFLESGGYADEPEYYWDDVLLSGKDEFVSLLEEAFDPDAEEDPWEDGDANGDYFEIILAILDY